MNQSRRNFTDRLWLRWEAPRKLWAPSLESGKMAQKKIILVLTLLKSSSLYNVSILD